MALVIVSAADDRNRVFGGICGISRYFASGSAAISYGAGKSGAGHCRIRDGAQKAFRIKVIFCIRIGKGEMKDWISK